MTGRRMGVGRVLGVVEGLVVIDPPFAGPGIEIQSVERTDDRYPEDLILRQVAFDGLDDPSLGGHLTLGLHEGRQATPRGFDLQADGCRRVITEVGVDVPVQAGHELAVDLRVVGDGLVEVIVSKNLQRPVRQRAEAGGIEFDAAVLYFIHAQRPLEPELGRVGEVGLEGRRGDGLQDAGRAAGFGEGHELMGVRDLPVGLGIAIRGVREQVADSGAQRLIRRLEEQAGRAQRVTVGILLGYDDVQPAVAEASTPELLERECRRGEHGLVRRQAGHGA